MTSHPRSPAPTRPSARWVSLLVGLTVVAAVVVAAGRTWPSWDGGTEVLMEGLLVRKRVRGGAQPRRGAHGECPTS